MYVHDFVCTKPVCCQWRISSVCVCVCVVNKCFRCVTFLDASVMTALVFVLPPNYRVIPLHRGVIPAVPSPNLTLREIGSQVGATIEQVGVTSDQVGMTTSPVSIEILTGVAPRRESLARYLPDIHQNQIVTQLQLLPHPQPLPRHQRNRNRYFSVA